MKVGKGECRGRVHLHAWMPPFHHAMPCHPCRPHLPSGAFSAGHPPPHFPIKNLMRPLTNHSLEPNLNLSSPRLRHGRWSKKSIDGGRSRTGV